MALHALAYNLTRVMNIMSTQPLMAAIKALAWASKGGTPPSPPNADPSGFCTTKTRDITPDSRRRRQSSRGNSPRMRYA
jgi:hypothetical protein